MPEAKAGDLDRAERAVQRTLEAVRAAKAREVLRAKRVRAASGP